MLMFQKHKVADTSFEDITRQAVNPLGKTILHIFSDMLYKLVQWVIDRSIIPLPIFGQSGHVIKIIIDAQTATTTE